MINKWDPIQFRIFELDSKFFKTVNRQEKEYIDAGNDIFSKFLPPRPRGIEAIAILNTRGLHE